MKKNLTAFTLLELSIVLMIIALFSASILFGREMIKTFEIRSIFKQNEQFETARNTFRSKYNCLAGDCANAAAFNLGTNGNGNGRLDVYGTSIELYQYWMQLGNAELIHGNYTGQPGPIGYYDYVIAQNIPSTIRKDTGIGVIQHVPTYTTWLNRFGKEERPDTHFYVIGRDTETGGWGNWGGTFSIADVMGTDLKYDDGLANAGRLRVHAGIAAHHTVGCTLPIDADQDATPDFDYGTDPTALCTIWYLFWP